MTSSSSTTVTITTTARAAAEAGVGGRCCRGPRSLRKAAGPERAAAPCPPRPGRRAAGYPCSAVRRAAESGGLRSAPQPAGRRCPLRAAPRGCPAARAARPGAKGGGESCKAYRCERHQLPYKGLFLAERRRLLSEAIRH